MVGTVHEESGRANVSGLLAILERIHPEVIFLESPPAAFDNYLNRAPRTLEATAATRYREFHPVDLVPVDLPTPEVDLFRDNRDLHERIERRSPEYCRLVDWHSQYVRGYGFEYLNSEHCSQLFAKLHEVMLVTIEQLADPRLAELYELWIRTNEARDKGMMKNIEDHCWQTSFSNAAFLVGAAHRQFITDMARGQPGAVPSAIHWMFAGFLEETNRQLSE